MQLDLCNNDVESFKQHIKLVNLSNDYGQIWSEFCLLFEIVAVSKNIIICLFFKKLFE